MSTVPTQLPCPGCGGPPGSTLACLRCGRLLEELPGSTHFQRLGLAPGPGAGADAASLERAYLQLSRLLHPDFHGGADADLRDLALRNSALLNEAYVTLGDDESRAEYLLGLHDPQALERWKLLSPEFLMAAMETSEATEQAVAERDGTTLARLGSEVGAEIARRLATLNEPGAWTSPDARLLATLLHELRVLRRMLHDMGHAT